jgi:LPXTG-motif cell wall-anchored protein
MVRRILLIAAAILAIGVASMAPASAGNTYGGCNAAVSDTTPEPGQTVTVSGTGAADGGTVSASIADNEIATGTADAAGAFEFEATIPASATGTVSLAVSCGANRGTFPITLTVVAGSGNLPATGTSSTIPLTLIALGALAVGGVVLGGARLRTRSAGKHIL